MYDLLKVKSDHSVLHPQSDIMNANMRTSTCTNLFQVAETASFRVWS